MLVLLLRVFLKGRLTNVYYSLDPFSIHDKETLTVESMLQIELSPCSEPHSSSVS